MFLFIWECLVWFVLFCFETGSLNVAQACLNSKSSCLSLPGARLQGRGIMPSWKHLYFWKAVLLPIRWAALFSFNTLNISFHYILAFFVSYENSAVNLLCTLQTSLWVTIFFIWCSSIRTSLYLSYLDFIECLGCAD
jgi:hypothetical protein